MQASPLTWWRSSCQTSASDLSLSPPRSVSWWLRLTATQAPPTSRPSHGYDPSLFISIERCDWVRGNSYWCHSLKKEKCDDRVSPVPKLSSPHRESLPASIKFPKNFQPVGVSYRSICSVLATLKHTDYIIWGKKKDSWFALFPNLPKNIKTVLVFTCPRLHW